MSPFIDYGQFGYTALSTEKENIIYEFTMLESTDLNARISINAGSNPGNIYIDNVSLKIESPSRRKDQFSKDTDLLILSNFPNPFRVITRIEYQIPESAVVMLSIYNVAGQKVKEIDAGEREAGRHTLNVDLAALDPGIYFYSLDAKAENSGRNYKKTNNMVLLK